MDENQNIDFTQEVHEPDPFLSDPRVIELMNNIKVLENKLRFPDSFKKAVGAAVISYALARKEGLSNEISIAAAFAGGAAANKLLQTNELTDEQRAQIKSVIIEQKKRLESLAVEIKGETIGVLTAEELEKVDYDRFAFDGKYAEFMGLPAVGFHACVWGLPKAGKSIWSFQFADYLAEDFGEVIYIAAEEGFKGTIKDKVKNWTSNRSSLHFSNAKGLEEIQKIIEKYDFVFIDSLDKCKLTVDDMEQLKAANPMKSFITVHQVTKEGAARGSQEYMHNADILIEVLKKDKKAVQTGRYMQQTEMPTFG